MFKKDQTTAKIYLKKRQNTNNFSRGMRICSKRVSNIKNANSIFNTLSTNNSQNYSSNTFKVQFCNIYLLDP